jgi:hypothetical protein
MKNVQFENDILLVPVTFNKLRVVEENEERFLKGSLEIADGTDKVWDTYEIEIKGSAGYPYAFPKLYETNSAFPKNEDWHVYIEDNSCCVDVPMNEKIICQKGLNITDYIKQYAIPYFANQTYRNREGYYLHGEYSHGFMGRLEFYQSKLRASSPIQLLEMFKLILKEFNPGRRAMCPFCHKEKFRRCHRDAFRELYIAKDFLNNDGLILLKYLNLIPNFKLPNVKDNLNPSG